MRNVILAGLIGGLLLTACKKEEEVTDEEAILSKVNSSPIFTQKGPAGPPGNTSLMDTINLLFWWREPTNYPDGKVFIDVQGDSAYVELTAYVEGILHLLDTQWQGYTKNFANTWKIKGIFKRTGNPESEDRGWRLWAISGIRFFTTDTSVSIPAIDSMNVRLGNNTHLVTDPLDFIKLSDIDTASVPDTFGLTVYSPDTTLNVYFHILGPKNEHIRIWAPEENSGVYGAEFYEDITESGYHWIVGDFFTWATHHDLNAPYENLAWFYLYYVE